MFPPINKSNKCERCGLRYPEDNVACCYCSGLSDIEVSALKKEHRKQLKAGKNTGLMLFIACFATLIILLVFL